jgi:hypothetical protein
MRGLVAVVAAILALTSHHQRWLDVNLVMQP